MIWDLSLGGEQEVSFSMEASYIHTGPRSSQSKRQCHKEQPFSTSLVKFLG